MELRTLRYILTTAAEGNITRAADVLHVAQPTLSRHLDRAIAVRSSQKLKFIPIYPEKTTSSVLVWKKNQLFSPATALFIQEINMLRAQIR